MIKFIYLDDTYEGKRSKKHLDSVKMYKKKLYLDIKRGSIRPNSQNGLYGHLYILKS